MRHLIIILIIITFFNSCSDLKKNDIEKDTNILDVSLEWTNDQKIEFDKTRFKTFLAYSLFKKFPDRYKDNLSNVRNIPKLDSFMLISLDLQKLPSVYNLYKSGYIGKQKIIEIFPNSISDTIALDFKKPINSSLSAISGFKNGEQFIIPDLNFNNDFSDDLVMEYPIEVKDIFTTNLKDKSKFKKITLAYQTVENGEIYNVQRQVLIYPRASHKHAYLKANGIIDDHTNQYTIMLELLEYAEGNFDYEGTNYEVSIQGKSHEDVEVVLKPESFIYEKDNSFLQQFITYRLGDTINLGKNSFIMANLTGDFKKLSLRKIDLKSSEITNNSIRNSFSNESVQDFDGNNFDVFPQEKSNKYSLIEFWGSWCKPCKELTPQIKAFNENYSDKVNLTSIAYEDDLIKAIDYVENNDLDWRHGVVMSNRDSKNIKDAWNIISFPTFLLFDKEHRLIYAGNKGRALVKIDSIMMNIRK
ncbi:MAG: thiol-disulfide isomerase/thioredoxin [Polaribacter sp.]|jgi:thiol-disulfide isomerase/thioredoxin